MRIFLAISPASTWGVKNNQTWLRALYEPLVDLGHDVYLFRNDLIEKQIKPKIGSQRFQSVFSQKLLDIFKKENTQPFDLFFSYFIDRQIDPLCIDDIKKTGVLTCNFSCNNTHQFYLTEKIAHRFDYNLHSEKNASEKFKAIGATPIWFQMAANPNYYKPYDVARTIDVSFVGQMYARRPYYIRALLENDVDVQVYGPGWTTKTGRLNKEWLRLRKCLHALIVSSPEARARYSAWLAQFDYYGAIRHKFGDHLHPPLPDEEMIRLYSRSQISLGFLEVFDGNSPDAIVLQHLHLREFEAPMSGALYFTGFTEELSECYVPDKEVVVYHNEHELLTKVRYYLSHPNDAQKVRQAGLKRARACHTFHERFRKLFRTVGLGGGLTLRRRA